MARLEDTLKKIYGLPESGAAQQYAGRADRMINSNERMNQLADSGFDSTNMRDEFIENAPLLPDFARRMMQSSEYKLNDANKRNFMTAMLRKETGAVINDSEMEWMDQTYFPQFGDGPEVIEQKRQAREQAIQQMQQEVTPESAGYMKMGSAMPETGAVERTMSPEELNDAINALMMGKQNTNDPEEILEIDKTIDETIVRGNAPYNDLMNQLALTGGEDDIMAHVRTGDINLSKEMVTPEIESLIEEQARKAGIEPETMVYGNGIASLRNQMTGLEQHGWFKKTAKSIKKSGRTIAQIAAVVPGPWQIPATMAVKGYTAYDVAKGNISPIQAAAQWAGANKAAAGARASVAAGTQPSGNIFARTKEYFTKGADNMNFLDNITAAPTFDPKTGDMSGGSVFGRAKEYLMPGQDDVGLFGNIGQTFGMGGGQPQQSVDDIANSVPGAKTRVERLRSEGMSDADIMKDLQFSGYAPQATQSSSFFGGQTPQGIKSIGDAIGLGGASGLRDVYGGGGQGGQGGGGMGGLGSLAGMALAGGIAGKLGKLAYDEAKDQKGVSLSPVVAMDATGRYNLEAEMARRMGQQAPNPVEFGLLPANTFPQLSGGQRLSQAFNNQEPVMAAGGGAVYPMAYAEGGNVAMEDFNRMNGHINGEGTETSDDIPAMLSDGEFVMTGQAVRGAGAYKMKNDSGIVTLTPSGSPSRDAGTETMYNLMEAFSSRTGPI